MKETYLVVAQMAYLRFAGDEEEDGNCTLASFSGHGGGSGEVAQTLGRIVGDHSRSRLHSISKGMAVVCCVSW